VELKPWNHEEWNMKVAVDLGLCDRQAVCIGVAPAVFDFNDDGELTVLQPEPPESVRDAVEDAAAACPMAAIAVEE